MKLSVVIPARNEAEQIGSAIDSARRASSSEKPAEKPAESSERSGGLRGAGEPETSRAPGGSAQAGGSLTPAPPGGRSTGPADGPAESAAQASEVEIIVVDGGSEDDTPARALEAGARVVRSSPGRARQLAVGAQESRGDVLVFLHADTRLPPGYESAIRRALRDPDVVGGAFRLRFDRRTPGLRVVEGLARVRGALFVMPYGDQALFVRRRILDEIGGVPQAPIMEDLDLVKAMKERGRLALLPLHAVTSARRYLERGPMRTALRHLVALAAWALRVDRARVAAWYGR